MRRSLFARAAFAAAALSALAACAQGRKAPSPSPAARASGASAAADAAVAVPAASEPPEREAPAASALEPIEAHPLAVLSSDPASFRRGRYELFSWKELPGILVFRFKDYAAQDDYLKRLAFFVEKKGFRGRLARDEEIRGLHGWNAHDYRARDLGRFFAKAEAEGFPLNASEIELRDLLLSSGHLIRGGNGIEGADDRAIVSTSPASGAAMERRFMAHELYHGIYFTDPEFRAAAAELWARTDPGVKDYVLEYFDYKEYALDDEDLMVNELASYFLQQPPAEAPAYFATTVAGYLEADRGGDGRFKKRAIELKEKFIETGKAYEALAEKLYGFAAGRAWR